jgi:hypothetical protein
VKNFEKRLAILEREFLPPITGTVTSTRKFSFVGILQTWPDLTRAPFLVRRAAVDIYLRYSKKHSVLKTKARACNVLWEEVLCIEPFGGGRIGERFRLAPERVPRRSRVSNLNLQKGRRTNLPLLTPNTDAAAQQNPPPFNGAEKPAGGVPSAPPRTSPPPRNRAKGSKARKSSAQRPIPPSPKDAEKPADGTLTALPPTRRPDPDADRPFPPRPGMSVRSYGYFAEGADFAAVGSRLPTRDAPTQEKP